MSAGYVSQRSSHCACDTHDVVQAQESLHSVHQILDASLLELCELRIGIGADGRPAKLGHDVGAVQIQTPMLESLSLRVAFPRIA